MTCGIQSSLPSLRSLCAGHFQSISTSLEGFLLGFLSRQDGLTGRASERIEVMPNVWLFDESWNFHRRTRELSVDVTDPAIWLGDWFGTQR